MAILAASVSLEEHGVANANIESTVPYAVGDVVTLTDPVTSVAVFCGIVTRCVQDVKSGKYSVMLQDPISALSEGKVLWSTATGVLAVLAEIATDYGQSFDTALSSSVDLAPIVAGAEIDPDDEIDVDPVDWVSLVRTVERVVGAPLTYRSDGGYHMAAGTDRGTLTNSQLLDASISALTDRYANRVVAKCSGEWWSDPGSETTAMEMIRGALMTVRRYGEQVREITLNSGGAYHHEVMTYDASNRMTGHVVTVITTLANGTQYKTETTRSWSITDEVTYTYVEATITQVMGYWETEWRNQTKREVTTVVTDGSAEETVKGYGWNYDLSEWNPLITNDSMTVMRGFPGQPGVSEYGVKETYRYWYDTDRSEWVYDQVKAEVVSSAPTAPGYSVILPLTKHTVSYCMTAEDETAQGALGLKEADYSPLCVQDDESMTVLETIALNELAWRSRCRQLTAELALSVGESWLTGDTFSYGGLTWTIERLDHDLKSRKTGVTATAQASIAFLQKSLMPEYDQAGRAIVGIMKKQAAKVDNVQPATIVVQRDYETWVVRLPDGKKKLAKLQYGSGALLMPGASVMLMRGSML